MKQYSTACCIEIICLELAVAGFCQYNPKRKLTAGADLTRGLFAVVTNHFDWKRINVIEKIVQPLSFQ